MSAPEDRPVHVHLIGGPAHGRTFETAKFLQTIRVPVEPEEDPPLGRMRAMRIALYVWHPQHRAWVYRP